MSDWHISSAAWTAIPQFTASTAYTVGQIVRPLTAPAFNAQFAFRCTTAGTSSTEPSWPGGNNATVTTGTVTFTNVSGQSTYGWAAAAGNIWCLTSNGPTGASRFVIGDRGFLSSDHTETNTNSAPVYSVANNTGAFSVVQMISVNRAGSVPPVAADALSGATIVYNNSNSITFDGACYWQGVTMNCGGTGQGIILGGASQKTVYLRNCALVFSTSNTGATLQCGSGSKAALDNTTMQFNNAGQRIAAQNGAGDIQWINTPSAILGTIPTILLTASTTQVPQVTCRGVDLSALTTTLMFTNQTNTFGKMLLDSCRVAPGVVRLGTTSYNNSSDEVELVNCFDGAAFISERHTPAGDLTTDLSAVLSGGAQDNVGAFSHKMISSIRPDKFTMTLDSFWMDVNNTAVGSAKTATVELLGPPLLNTDDISLVLEYQGTTGSSLASFVSSLNPLATVTTLSTSTATWNNTPAAPANTLDPYFNTTNQILLSGGNLVATGVSSSNNQNTRGIYSFTSGKIYFEATMVTSGGVNSGGAGICNPNCGTGFLGNTPGGFMYRADGGVWTNGGSIGSILTFATSDVICVAVDVANKKIWFRKNGLLWDNNAAHDPAANVGGYDLTAFLANNGTVYPGVGTWGSPDSVRINLGTTAFAQTMPSGYSNLASGPAWTKQKLSVSFTPRVAGRVRGQVRLGKTLTTVWVNPQMAIT